MYILRFLEPLVTLIVLILFFRQRKASILWYYLLISFVVDVATIVMRRVLYIPNYEKLSAIFVLVEFIIFLYYFYRWKMISKQWFIGLSIVCGSLYAVGLFGARFHHISDSFLHSLMLIPQLSISLYSFYKLMRDSEYSSITNLSFFWGNTAIFIYTSCSFLLRLSQNYIENNYPLQVQKSIFLFFLLFVMIKTVLMGVGLSKTKANAN